jgi:hypothetical protein
VQAEAAHLTKSGVCGCMKCLVEQGTCGVWLSVQVWLLGSCVQWAEPAADVLLPVHGAMHHCGIWLGLDAGVERHGHGERKGMCVCAHTYGT